MAVTVQSAHTSLVDGLVKQGRSAGMNDTQLQAAGRALIANINESLAANPLMAAYFPGLGDGLRALAGAIELALTDLTQDVPPELGAKIHGAYEEIAGRDPLGRPNEIGPLLRGELIELANTFTGTPEELDAAIKAHIMGSQEVADAKRTVVDGNFRALLGRGPNPTEGAELQTYVGSRLGEGADFQTISREIQNRVLQNPEYSLLERVGTIFHQVFSDHDAPDLSTKRKWTDWVQNQVAMGVSEAQALQMLVPALQG
ncbi:MAG: hypothetical protein HY791_16295 [Deltaproteobacteria bacterium]|nr:hypothetical protein [Deltaproteobacteria bacterium]